MISNWIFTIVAACLVFGSSPIRGSNIWNDVMVCVKELSNETRYGVNSTRVANLTSRPEQADRKLSIMKLFTTICGDKNGFVRCLETSIKQSSDSMAQVVGSLFDPQMVLHAYEGLCANISAIEQKGDDVLSCLSKVRMTSCQSEMADYIFYMGVVKKFAPPSEQLSQSTMETLLCSVTFQRRQCEVKALRQCSAKLADIMEEFYRQTQPDACDGLGKEEHSVDNNVQ
ncbi:uncharacterized protein LOC131944547 [Physella acuta]|uniref:uncharacterized protein LOC131944547 n=1 Tax=Physella acuta TaxID=109671 RepID=UPI0027DD7DAA|nr:uncharacterized protein LOC131944547 [Physella acuta]